MRVFARIGFAVGVLALAAPATAQAQSQSVLSKPWNHGFHRNIKKTAVVDTTHLCNDCQRAMTRMSEGVEIPAAPAMPAGMMVNTGPCSACKKPVMVVREVVRPGIPMPRIARRDRAGAPPAGIAVASDEPGAMMPAGMMMSGADPMPVGIYQQKVAAASAAPMMGKPGLSDPSLMQTSAVKPASNPIIPPRMNRPHIISHLFGFSEIGKEHSQERERRGKESHAKIEYGDLKAETVTDLPAKAVYGK